MTEQRLPVLVGAGEVVQREPDPATALEPLALAELAARRALEDAGGDPRLVARIDCVALVSILSWRYARPTRTLAERLGIGACAETISTVGGNSPQLLVNRIAARIARGELRAALLAGAEALRTLSQARRQHVELRWLPRATRGEAPGVEVVGDDRPGTSELEADHGLVLPPHIYPLFENAWRGRHGLDLAAHRAHLGQLGSRLSEVAADNPIAWFQRKRSADEIVRVTDENRMIAFPYTKFMNAILEVDQAAALVLTSSDEARALGIPEQRWIHVWGGGEAAEEPWWLCERPRLDASPALRAAAAAALAQAGISADEVDCFDLYSCFPSAVSIACDELGIDPLGERPLTVTGGLPYHGGPGNNYTTHAIARMMARLRAEPGAVGMVTALGWYLSKHAAGVYAAAPPRATRVRALPHAGDRAVPLAREAHGAGRVETYTVLYDRDGAPSRGIVVGRLDDERRFLALLPEDRALLESFASQEALGRAGRVRPVQGHNEFTPH